MYRCSSSPRPNLPVSLLNVFFNSTHFIPSNTLKYPLVLKSSPSTAKPSNAGILDKAVLVPYIIGSPNPTPSTLAQSNDKASLVTVPLSTKFAWHCP